MAATPDLSTLTSSAQIFSANNYTLPQIRSLHKQINAQIDDTAARLRTQVGGSYRELLGTADTIVRMRADMDTVQSILGGMGGRCGRAVVAAKEEGLARFLRERRGGGGGEHADVVVHVERGGGSGGGGGLGAVARARLLEGCVLAAGNILRTTTTGTTKEKGTGKEGGVMRGDRLIVAAEIWVLGRLLSQNLTKSGNSAGEGAKKNLQTLHSKLMRAINRVLKHVPQPGKEDKEGSRGVLTTAFSAYSLATSSGARDVLRHFLRVRGEAMASALEQQEGQKKKKKKGDVLRCMELYTRTLVDVQAIVPHKLTEALLGLKKGRLLADESLRAIEGLRLDMYERWCGDGIQYYTPFIRHDDLDGPQAREMLASWAKQGGQVLLQGLQKTLEGMTDFESIVEMRTRVLGLWIAEGGKARGIDPSIVLNKIRETVNGHMLKVLEQKVNKLRLVGSEVAAALDTWREGTAESLWDVDSVDMDLGNGASQFTKDVVARLYGRNDAVSKAVNCYTSWYHVMGDVGRVVEGLRRQRWDNDADDMVEDEETIEERQAMLGREDPQMLHDHLKVTLTKAFKNLDDHVSLLWKKQEKGEKRGQVAMYLLRLLRDVRARLPAVDGAVEGATMEVRFPPAFGLGVVPSLHEVLASTVVATPLGEFGTSYLARKTVVGRSLWEGTEGEELPTSPSPGILRFLRNLSKSMGDAGGDLWSPTAVAVLKQHVSSQVSSSWKDALAKRLEPPEKEVDGEKEGTEEASQKEEDTSTDDQQLQDLLVQWLFDMHYLSCFLSPIGDDFKGLEEAVTQKITRTLVPKEQLVKASKEYAKRTSLLFGLLT